MINKNHTYLKSLFIFCFLTQTIAFSFGQSTIQVITKTITQEIPIQNCDTLILNGEKSNITLKGWDKDYIGITIQLIAKSKNKNQAEEDLNILKYKIQQKNRNYIISNYFHSGNNLPVIKSNLSATFDIYIPPNLAVKINNLYGDISLIDTNSPLLIDLHFGSLQIDNANAIVDIKCSYADLKIERSRAKVYCITDRSDISVDSHEGELNIKSAYGSITILSSYTSPIIIDSKRTKVDLEVKNFDDHFFNILTTHSKIILPEKYADQVKNNLGKTSFYYNSGKKNLIHIKTSYSPINIK